jgi:SAM-dependent methyltransferase
MIVLDLPFGTGRFLPLYRERQHVVIGMDISMDMLNASRAGAVGSNQQALLVCAEGESIPLDADAVDTIVSVRLFNWLPPQTRTQVLQEMTRVSRDTVLLQIRVAERMSLGQMAATLAREGIRHPEQALRGLWRRVRHRVRRRTPEIGIVGDKAEIPTRDYTVPWDWEFLELLQAAGLRVERVLPISRTIHPRDRRICEKRLFMLRVLPKIGPVPGNLVTATDRPYTKDVRRRSSRIGRLLRLRWRRTRTGNCEQV